MAGPSIEDGFNLPGAVDLSVRAIKNVSGDTPPGPGLAGFLTDSHETVSGDDILAVPFSSGLRRCSGQHETLSTDGTLLSADGLFATPGSAGLRGRRASRAARRVQISENSFNRSGKCVDSAQSCSFSDNFEPHRRVISCDNDLFALDLPSKSALVSDSRVLGASSVSRPVGCVRASVLSGVSARRVCCGRSLDGSDVSRCRVCAENACGVMANSGSDHIDRNSWKHGPELSGGTKALNQCSGTTGRRSFVDTVVGGAALAQYLRGWLLVVGGCWLLVVGCWLLVVGCWCWLGTRALMFDVDGHNDKAMQ